MIKEDMSTIREVAVDLISGDPISSYRLLRLARKRHPEWPYVKRLDVKVCYKLIVYLITAPPDAGIKRQGSIAYRALKARLTGFPRRLCKSFPAGGMSRAEFDVLKDVAIELEYRDPVSSYKLYRLMLKYMPEEQFVERKEKELREKLFGYMFTSRRDGTTERLNAIILGYVIALKSDIPFRFSWATNVGAVLNELCSVKNELPEFINPRFIDQFYMDFKELKKYRVSANEVPECEFISALKVRTPVSKQDKNF